MNTCPRCQASDVVGFRLSPSGQPLRFSHCRACEHRWWASESEGGSTLVLSDVLEKISAA